MRTVCSYCLEAPAIHSDHIFSKALRRRFPEWDMTVPACFDCNILKGTRRLLPPSYAHRQQEIEGLTGKRWKVWDGSRAELQETLR